MVKRKHGRQAFVWLLMILLVFSSFSQAFAQTAQTHPDVSMKEQMKVEAEEKVEQSLFNALQQDKVVDVLIKLTEQVDVDQVAHEAKQQLSSQATPYQQKMEARFAVVDALQSTAQETQKPLLKLLDSYEEKGLASDIQSFFIVNMIKASVSREVVDELAQRSDVAKIMLDEEVYLVEPAVDQSLQTELQTELQTIEWNIERVGAPQVWDTYGIDGTGVVVGTIDSGAAWEHEALKEKWRGYNPQDPDNPNPVGNWFDATAGRSLPYDNTDVPHGTHVLGTILGQDAQGQHVIGVAPGAKWIAARAFSGTSGQSSWLLASGEYMLAPINAQGDPDPSLAPDIINNSWGGGSGLDEWYRPMVQAWRAANIIPVFAAGNTTGGSQPGSVSVPANYPEVLAVAATDIQNQRGSFSNQGPGPYDGVLKPEISAPGVNIRSSVPTGYEGGWNGTSMAAPHVAGTIALMLSANSALTFDEIKATLLDTAVPLTDAQYPDSPNYGYGYGLVNALDAVATITQGTGTISGTVLTEGTDDDPAGIEHTPFDHVYAGLDISVEATITDNVSVNRAELWVKPHDQSYWIVIPMERSSGDHSGGVYRGTIPWMFVQEPGFTYQIKALDYGRILTETEQYEVDVTFGVKPDEFEEDFEFEPLGWTLDGDWQWGEPTVGPEPVVGSKLVGTNLFGEYSSNSESQLLLPPLDLRDATEASLRLFHWYETELNYDQGIVAVTNDYGENWEVLQEFSGRDGQWRTLVIDLNDYAGSEQQVFVLFGFFSDGSVNETGWYLDHVQLKGEDTDAPQAPSSLEANARSSGIHLTWTAPSDPDVMGYRIYRAADGEAFELLASTGGTSYTDGTVEEGTAYTYAVTAYDYSDNESDRSNEVSIVAPTVVVFYDSDFEADDGGLLTGGTNNSWGWGVPTSGPEEASSGEQLWATNLDGNYFNSSSGWIETPLIDLQGVQEAELSFNHWYYIERNFDKGKVLVSADQGSSWTELALYSERKGEWENVSLSLDSFIGQIIKVRFELETDSSVTNPGWYIDDLRISGISSDQLELGMMSVGEQTTSVTTEQQATSPDQQRNRKAPKVDEILQQIQIRGDQELYNYRIEEVNQTSRVDGLPVDAVVTVLETGRSVRTNLADGSYTLVHPANVEGETWTLRVDAYGYYSEQESITLEDQEHLVKNFMLEKIPRGSIHGEVVNERNGEAIADATVRLLEDRRVAPVTTGIDGSFSLDDVLQGEYTLEVRAQNYHPAQVTVNVVGGEATVIEVELKPFIGYGEDIAYDDGTAENARAFNQGGNGWAMRMTPSGLAAVKGASVYLWGTDWPIPGSDEFMIAVFDSLPNGEPGEMVIEPVLVEGVRGAWNDVDLSEFGFSTDRDFYIVMIQIDAYPNSPGLGMDENSPFAGRSYWYLNGAFEALDSEYGNIMIRAKVEYALDAPRIETPEDGTYTNQEQIEVSGTIQTDSLVTLYVNEEAVSQVEAVDGQFTTTVPLAEGENRIQATATVEAGETDPSPAVTVIRDTQTPQLIIEQPSDGMVTNREVITVSGQAIDQYLDRVIVNDQEAELDEEGRFQIRLLADEGENLIRTVAIDRAGNETVDERTVHVNTQAPMFFNVQPEEDVHLSVGESVYVSFESSSYGGQASFMITVPLQVDLASNRIAMEEVSDGFYAGEWTAPEGLQLQGGIIEIELIDQAGNRATTQAEGRVYVSGSDPDPNPDVERFSTNRLTEMAQMMSQDGWSESQTVVIVRDDQLMTIALASQLAYQYQAPLLLAEGQQRLGADTWAEMERLRADEVILVGSVQRIDQSVEDELVESGYRVQRVEGSDPTEIAANIALRFETAEHAILLHNDDSANAFTVASYSAGHGIPLLTTDGQQLAEETHEALTLLGVDDVLVVSDHIGEPALDALPYYEQITYNDKYVDSVQLLKFFGDLDSTTLVIAHGEQYEHALVAAPWIAKQNAMLLYVNDPLSDATRNFLSSLNVERMVILGDEGVIDEDLARELGGYLP